MGNYDDSKIRARALEFFAHAIVSCALSLADEIRIQIEIQIYMIKNI